METSRVVVAQTKVGIYTRPLWDVRQPFDPEKIGSRLVFADFDRFEAVAEAIAEGDFRMERLIIRPSDIPLICSGKRRLDVIEFGIGKEIPLHELLRQVIVGRHCLFCPPLAAVLYVLRVKERSLEHPVATLFHTEGDSRLCQLAIFPFRDGLGIETDFVSTEHCFGEDTNFLAVDQANRLRG